MPRSSGQGHGKKKYAHLRKVCIRLKGKLVIVDVKYLVKLKSPCLLVWQLFYVIHVTWHPLSHRQIEGPKTTFSTTWQL